MPPHPLDRDQRIGLLFDMLLVRAFEERVSLLAHAQGRVPGMQITCHGQEAVAAGVVRALQGSDVIVTNHRSHGHLLVRGVDPGVLLAEIMGKQDGVNHGKSGTLHMAVPEYNVLMTTTVVGAGAPLAVGAAFAQHYRGEKNVTCLFFGDGAAAEGSVHEAMNLAAVWKLPVLFVCESNGWAGAQPYAQHCSAGRIADRAAGYGMPGQTVDGNDVERVHQAALALLEHCRAGAGPALLECITYRMHGHGEHDPHQYMSKAELARWAKRDPIALFVKALGRDAPAGFAAEVQALRDSAAQLVDRALAFADASPYPPAEEALDHLYANPIPREG